MTALTLPGSIPGLLRRGSPIRILATVHAPGAYGVITGIHPWGYRVAVDPGTEDYHGPTGTFMAEDIALDLTDATGRAHAAWWLAAREMLPCTATHFLDPAAVSWSPAPGQADCGWMLHWVARARVGSGSLTGGGWTGRHRDHSLRRCLQHLDRDDARLLDDGSRWVDAEALRRVVLHVAGVPG